MNYLDGIYYIENCKTCTKVNVVYMKQEINIRKKYYLAFFKLSL